MVSRLFSLAAVAATGALYFFSTGLTGIRPLVWIAPVPVLFLSMRSSRRDTVAIAFCAYILGELNLVGSMAAAASIGVVIGSLLIPALAFAVIVVAFRDAIVHLRHPLAFLAFPVGWTAYEFILASVSSHGSAGSIAYTQSDFLPLIQIASLAGIQGITFVVTLVPAGIVAALNVRSRREFLLTLSVVLAVAFGTLVYGWNQLAAPASEQSVRVGLVSSNSASVNQPISVLSDARPGNSHRFYPAAGDWFAWVNLVFLLILVAAVSKRLMRHRTHIAR